MSRSQALMLVRAWPVIWESMPRSHTHPLEKIRQLALSERGHAVRGPQRAQETRNGDGIPLLTDVTARGTASRRQSRAPDIPINLPGKLADEALEIARLVRDVDRMYYETLALWADGVSLEGQAKARSRGKHTVYRWFEGGLGVVRTALVTRICR